MIKFFLFFLLFLSDVFATVAYGKEPTHCNIGIKNISAYPIKINCCNHIANSIQDGIAIREAISLCEKIVPPDERLAIVENLPLTELADERDYCEFSYTYKQKACLLMKNKEKIFTVQMRTENNEQFIILSFIKPRSSQKNKCIIPYEIREKIDAGDSSYINILVDVINKEVTIRRGNNEPCFDNELMITSKPAYDTY